MSLEVLSGVHIAHKLISSDVEYHLAGAFFFWYSWSFFWYCSSICFNFIVFKWSWIFITSMDFTSFLSLFPEILRVSGMMPNQGFGDLDRLRHRSPSPMASSNLMPNVAGAGIAGWNGLPQEVVSIWSKIWGFAVCNFHIYFFLCICLFWLRLFCSNTKIIWDSF